MVMSQASANNVLAQVVNSLGIEEAGSLSVDGSVEAGRVLMQGGDVNVASQTVRATDIIANADGNLILNSQFALDGGNIIGTATAGNITFDTLVAEPLNGQGGLVRLTAGGHSSSSPITGQSVSSGGNIIMNSGGEGIAADRVELDATGDISSTIAANTVLANAPNGNVSLNLQAGVIDGIAGGNTGSSPGVTGGTTGGNSPGVTGGTTGGSSPGITGGTSGSTGGTSSSSSSSSTGAFPSGRNDGVFGVPPGGSGSSSSSSTSSSGSSNTTGTSGISRFKVARS